MKKVVIVAPHFPPANFTAVHRCRFFASHLEKFGWEPIVLTVQPQYYRENLDPELEKILSPRLKIIKTKALPENAFINDIGIRSFLWHWVALRKLAKINKIDFVLIPIPPNYSALLGRLIYEEFKIPYGIDYIDPWVPPKRRKKRFLSKAWMSVRLAERLEPFAVKKISLITGVAESYFREVIRRNKLKNVITENMPYGIEQEDYNYLAKLDKKSYVFQKGKETFNFIYAGALLPDAHSVLQALCKGLKKLKKENPQLFGKIRIYFIGTGKSPDDPNGFKVKPMAEEFNLYGATVFEHPARIPYFDVLVHLQEADAILILGSTAEHYTPSKAFQAVFAKKPILALLHTESTACKFLTESNASFIVGFRDEESLDRVISEISAKIKQIIARKFDKIEVNYDYFSQYTAEVSAKKMAAAMDLAIKK